MKSREDIRRQRESLPTFEYKQELIDAIREYNVLVVIGETGMSIKHKNASIIASVYRFMFVRTLGSGKTTQIPQYILEEMPECKKIGVTQPR